MAVGSLLIMCAFLVWLPLGAGDDDGVQMIIKHQTGADNLTVNFSLTNFKRFYNCMCNTAWTKCIAELSNQSYKEQRVSEVVEASINTRTLGSTSRLLTCSHNVTSEMVICSMLFDNGDDISDDVDNDDHDDDDGRGTTQWLQLRREDCDCVGIKWRHSGETIFSKNNITSLRRLEKSCEEANPAKRNTVPTKASTTESSSHRKSKELSGENNAQDDKLWVIITTVVVVVVLVVIIVVLLFIVLKRGCRKKNKLTNSCREESATNLIRNNSVTYTSLDHPVSTEDNNSAGLTQSENRNITHAKTEACQKSVKIFPKQNNKLFDDKELCCVEIHDADQHFQTDDNYDVIEDDENDDKQKVKVGGLEAVRCARAETVAGNRGHEPGESSGQGDVYEGYEEHARQDRFPQAIPGPASKKQIQEGTLYSSVDEDCEIKYTCVVFKGNSLDTNTSLTDNSYEEMGINIPGSNNCISYEDMAKNSLPTSDKTGKEAISIHSDANSEEHYNPRKLSNTPGIGHDATSTLAYSTLRNETCKKTHTYDVLGANDVEPM